jgi:dolichol-phosphate mannosyltransferase
MDADFSHRAEDLPRPLATMHSADLVIGLRNVTGGKVERWSILRSGVSKGGSLYTRFLLGLPIRDCTSGFKCFHRRVLESLDLNGIRANGYAFQVEVNYLAHAAGFRVTETPIVFPNRRTGTSKMTGSIAVEASLLVWRLRQERRSATPGQRRARAVHLNRTRAIAKSYSAVEFDTVTT